MITDLAKELWLPRFSASRMSEHPMTENRFAFADDADVLEGLLSRVILYNDDHHTFDEVIQQVCRAIACSEFDAEAVAWEVHTRGQALVFEGEMFECLKVSSVLEEIALHTQVVT